jgi:hypothetical protein
VAVSAWEAIFMLVVLKIPMVYLAVVVWWAIRAEPVSGIEDDPGSAPVPLVPCDWNERRQGYFGRRRGLRPRPAGSRPRPRHGVRPAPVASGRR